ncbi:hypothetical protein BDV11DRAFT_207381 [Aspergillus similis]
MAGAAPSAETVAAIINKASTNCWLSPLIIIAPLTSQHVAAALALCVFFITKFSVRGGRRLNYPCSNSNDGGVVISLADFNQVQLSEDERTADIGVGLRWLDVYKALEPHDLAVAGGRVPSVGNSQYGVGAMGVVHYEIVLADSGILNTNAHENPDLFWALKGGGSNFGSSNPLAASPFPTRQRRASLPTNHLLVAALMQYHDAVESDDKATLIWSNNPTPTPAVFAPFVDVPSLQSLVARGVKTPAKFRTMSSRPFMKLYNEIDQARAEQTVAFQNVEGISITTVLQRICNVWFLAMGECKHSKDKLRVRDAIKKIEGVWLRYKYINYAARDQDALGSYGVDNVGRGRKLRGEWWMVAWES